MSERGPNNPDGSAEFGLENALERVLVLHFGEEYRHAFAEHPHKERVFAVSGMLFEIGEDPETVLMEAGVKLGEDDEI